jgi:hypothetical protein
LAGGLVVFFHNLYPHPELNFTALG